MWNEGGSHFRVVQKHDQFIHFQVTELGRCWYFTVVYGSPRAVQRRDLWNNLTIIGASMVDSWCLVGDFNAFLFHHEKTGGSSLGSRPDHHFLELVDRNSLVDLGFAGPSFTWKRGGVMARLDRALANMGWRNEFPEASVLHLPPLKSDHSPILIRLHGEVGRFNTASRLWKGIADSWKHVQEGMIWRVGDGRKARFWTDPWLPNGNTLCSYALGPLSDEDCCRVVADFTTVSGGWDWAKFDFLLPLEICNLIAATVPPSSVIQGDHIAWKHSKEGCFSTKTAYHAITKECTDVNQSFWRLLWKWRGMERIRSFLWLCGHNRLLTNVARKKRGIAGSDACSRCNMAAEDLMHTLRDCNKAKCIWLKLVHPSKWHIFFNASRLSWLSLNLSSNLGYSDNSWDVMFATACWYIWRLRNADVFEDSSSMTADPVLAIKKLTSDSIRAMDRHVVGGRKGVNHVKRFVCWRKPTTGWVKFNVDGAKNEAFDMSACGGVARDDEGRFLIGFMRKIGTGSVLNAELWSILCALEVAWNAGFKKLVIETDCLTAVNIITDSVQRSHPCFAMLSRINAWFMLDWEVEVVHTLREGNEAADALAAKALMEPMGLVTLHDPPPEGSYQGK
ncbi:Non-LTR retroelement reverse transcriptase [Senna tora]|uniref:Non-LTR retroelement reverse transcriptase n=1 Tax=Senna tora TaxID=362788 RepID=A0A834WVH9_9FABA|nr:Non-LTR retroelement reverse transcriptase [Senna tora]